MPKKVENKELVLGAVIVLLLAAVGIGTVTGEPTRPPGFDTLVGYWPLDEGSGTATKDINYGRHNGVVTDATSWTRESRMGRSALKSSWVARKGFVTVKKTPDLDMVDSFTLEVWVKPKTVTAPNTTYGSQYTIAGDFDSTYGRGYDLIMSHFEAPPGQVVCRMGYGSVENPMPAINVAAKTRLQVNRWYHLACVYDGKELKFYINGMLEGRTAAPEAPAPSPFQFTIGKGADGEYGWFDGNIDNVALFKVARKDMEIMWDSIRLPRILR